MIFDPLYLMMVLPAFLLAMYAQVRVKSAMSKFGKVANTTGLTGAAAARRILDFNGLQDVRVEQSRGWLSDHYHPGQRVLRLSEGVYNAPSVAAVGIAAHEAGHALQHASRFAPLMLRNAIAPTASFGSWLAFPMILLGFLLHMKGLALAGVLFFSLLVAFQLITLPVEYDASRRAKKMIADMGIIQTPEEAAGVSSVLGAAALTYVAATATAVVELLYWMMRLGILSSWGDD